MRKPRVNPREKARKKITTMISGSPITVRPSNQTLKRVSACLIKAAARIFLPNNSPSRPPRR
jgi:hypothetical protein